MATVALDNLNKVQDMVEEILWTVAPARSSDNLLYLLVCEKVAKINGTILDKLSMPMFLMHQRELGFPAYESVSRARRRLQGANEALKAAKHVEDERADNERVFIDYARR